MITEIWKDIPGYEDLYQVSNFGRIKSKCREVTVIRTGYRSGTYSYIIPERIMNQSIRSRYWCITLCKNGIHCSHLVHRLIAKTFFNDYSDDLEVNHINEDKLDNSLSNLEMCTRKYNKNYGTGNYRSNKNRSKPILQFSIDGELVKEWCSMNEVARSLGICLKDLWRACNNPKATAHKYIWRYKQY